MSFDFVEKVMCIGGNGTPDIQFYKKGFNLGGSSQPTWQDIILSGNTALTLVNAKANSLEYLKLFGNTEQRNLPSGYTQVNYVTNTAQTMIDTGVKFDFSKNYEIELKVRGVTGSWYILQAKETSGNDIWGFSGSQNGQTIRLGFGTNSTTSQITRVSGHIYYLKGTITNGNLTLYVKDETAGTENTATDTYTVTTGQSVNICLFGNLASQYVGYYSDVYFSSIKEYGNYIMNYVPCIQSTTAGFYDKASNTFKTTTNLSAGADVTVPTPSNPVDIVCNNGVVKGFYGNRFSTDGKMVGYIISTETGEIVANENYTVTAITKLLKGNYTASFTSSSSTVAIKYFRCWSYQSDGTTPIAEIFNEQEDVGTKTFTFTINNDCDVRFSYNTIRFSDMDVHPTNAIIYTDGTTETVEIIGKNLFNRQWQIGVYNTTSGAYSATANRICNVDMIQIEPSTKYTVSCPSYALANNMRWLFYDANKNFISASTTGATTITTPANAKYINFYIANNLTVETAPDLQLEQGSTATTYEPYFNGGTATAQDLYAVGTYKDVQSVIDGGVTRNVGIKVFDGTENWAKSSARPNSYYLPLTTLPDFVAINPLISSHFRGTSSTTDLNTDGYVYIGSGLNMSISTSICTTANGFKQYLADQYANGTPVIVVCPLATPTTETVTGQPMNIQAGTNIVEITQASIDNLGLEVKYKATV